MPHQGCKWQCLQSNGTGEKQSRVLPRSRYLNRAAGWARGMSEQQEMGPPGWQDLPGSSESLHRQKMCRIKLAGKALVEV